MTLPRWASPAVLLVLVLAVSAFAVPIVGPVRDSSARLVIAAGILVLGAGLAFILVRFEADDDAGGGDDLGASDSLHDA